MRGTWPAFSAGGIESRSRLNFPTRSRKYSKAASTSQSTAGGSS